MILKGSQRGGATQLAAHLLRMDENDHVELHEVSGFVADDVRGAFREAYAVSRGTKCKQFLFSLSLSPPPSETVPVAIFEQAIVTTEAKLGLSGQPRVIVFHEKQGRRHAHCVWSRIDAEAMKAINLSHFKLKLRDVARDLFLEHGWLMPPGLANSAEHDPRNFTREEWQQAKRAEQDAGDLKGTFQECWAMSDSGKAFAHSLESRGLYLARGDRRGFVAIDVKGAVYSIPKWTGLKTKQIEARLGDPAALRGVEETKAYIAEVLSGMLGRHLVEAGQQHRMEREPVIAAKTEMRADQRHRRSMLRVEQTRRTEDEARHRAQRLRTGLRGLWDRLTGRYVKTVQDNEADAEAARRRDEAERQDMVQSQLAERGRLQQMLAAILSRQRADLADIHREHVAVTSAVCGSPPVSAELAPKPRSKPPRSGQRRQPGPTL